jgi:TolB-like protein/class 3 adenylate cyclase/Tfp pilus assembly protein PilF
MVGQPSLADGPPERVGRRLAAVVSADVVGYSRLVERDEETTVGRVKAYFRAIVRPTVERHGGRIVKLMGDGALIEFPSVVDAVRCALEVQAKVNAEEAVQPEADRIRYRIGIHLGDVIIDGNDIQGHGVNVSSRLESLAEPGGICVSDTVRISLGSSLPLAFKDLGPQTIKNIAEPVRAYHLVNAPPGQSALSARETWSSSLLVASDPRRRSLFLILACIGMLAALVVAYLWDLQGLRRSGNSENSTQPPVSVAAMRPAIAVLPFLNLSEDKDQEYFVDGLTEDLITDLSHLSGLFVISRSSAFTYKGLTVRPQQVAQDLKVTHLVNGSVRRSGDQVRITAELVDVINDRQIWSSRYDRKLTDIFAVQDEVKKEIIAALEVRLTPGERKQVARMEAPTQNIEAYEYYLRGRHAMNLLTRRALRLAYYAFEKAVALDPSFAEAQAALAMTYAIDLTGSNSSWNDWVRSPARSRNQAILLAQKALATKAALATPELVFARISLADREYELALTHVRSALDREPGNAEAYAMQALVLTAAGRHQEALQSINESLHRDPKGPPSTYATLGTVQFALHDYRNAIVSLEQAFAAMVDGGSWFYAPFLYSALGHSGRSIQNYYIYGSGGMSAVSFYRFYRRQSDMDHLLEGLRKANVPEFDAEFNQVLVKALPVAGQALRDLLLGQSFQALCWNPRLNATFTFNREGSINWTARHDLSDTGRSRFAPDQVCMTLPVITQNREACFSVFSVKGQNYLTKEYDHVLAGPSLCYFKRKTTAGQ